jgi:phosphoribosyl-ATP pyrophosphohydrolase
MELPEGSSTVALLAGGVDAVGKKLVEEAAEVWMAARFEDDDALALECSQVLYYVACMMAARGIPLAAVEEKL